MCYSEEGVCKLGRALQMRIIASGGKGRWNTIFPRSSLVQGINIFTKFAKNIFTLLYKTKKLCGKLYSVISFEKDIFNSTH